MTNSYTAQCAFQKESIVVGQLQFFYYKFDFYFHEFIQYILSLMLSYKFITKTKKLDNVGFFFLKIIQNPFA